MIFLTNSYYMVKLSLHIRFLLKFWSPSHTKSKVYMCTPCFWKRIIQLLWKSVRVKYRYIVGGYRLHTTTGKKGAASASYQKGNRYTGPYAKKNDPQKPTTWTEIANINVHQKDGEVFQWSLSFIHLQKKKLPSTILTFYNRSCNCLES